MYEATSTAAAIATVAPLHGGKQGNLIAVSPLPKPRYIPQFTNYFKTVCEGNLNAFARDETTGGFSDKIKAAAQLREVAESALIQCAKLIKEKLKLSFDPGGEEELERLDFDLMVIKEPNGGMYICKPRSLWTILEDDEPGTQVPEQPPLSSVGLAKILLTFPIVEGHQMNCMRHKQTTVFILWFSNLDSGVSLFNSQCNSLIFPV